MKEINLSPLIHSDIEYGKIVTKLGERFKCEWDDSVHDSYGLYIKQLQEYSREVHSIRCKAETLEREIADLKITELKKKVEILCREADAI